MENNKLEIELEVKEPLESEILESDFKDVDEQFSEFLHTKGIKSKFKLAFSNMAESAKIQRQKDKEAFAARKAQSREENKEFVEFLETKGVKAKYKLVIENIKKGAKESNEKVKAQIAEQKELRKNGYKPVQKELSNEEVIDEFNNFLKSKGLDNNFQVSLKK